MSLPTFEDIRAQVCRVHPLSPRSLRSDFKALEIEPVGRRQRPNRYPIDTAARILAARGHAENMIHGQPAKTKKAKR